MTLNIVASSLVSRLVVQAQGGKEPFLCDVGNFSDVSGVIGMRADSYSAHACYLEARSLGGVGTSHLQEIVIASGDHKLCYKYARHVPGADVQRLQEVVMASLSAEYCHVFGEFVKGADLASLATTIVKTNDVVYCYHFALLTQSHSLGELQAVVRRIGSDRLNLMFENDVPGAKKRSHLKVVK